MNEKNDKLNQAEPFAYKQKKTKIIKANSYEFLIRTKIKVFLVEQQRTSTFKRARYI